MQFSCVLSVLIFDHYNVDISNFFLGLNYCRLFIFIAFFICYLMK
jgi:hypothetical protein